MQLDDAGAAQVRAVGERLAKVPLAAVVSSPLERCVQTADAVAAGRDLAVQTDDRLGEARYGDWTGRTIKELSKEPLWKVVQQHPSAAVFPGDEGEGLAQTQARAVAAVRAWNATLGPGRRLAGVQPRRRHQGDPGRRARACTWTSSSGSSSTRPRSRWSPTPTPGRSWSASTTPAATSPALIPPPRRRRRRKASSDAVVGGGAGTTA